MPKKLFTATFTFEGKRYYVRSAKSQKDADRKAIQKENAMIEGTNLLDENTTFAEYAAQWFTAYKKNTVSEPVAKGYESRIRRYLNPEIGHIKLKDTRPIYLQQIINKQADMSKNFYEKLRQTIKQIFDQAVRDKLIRENPSSALQYHRLKMAHTVP